MRLIMRQTTSRSRLQHVILRRVIIYDSASGASSEEFTPLVEQRFTDKISSKLNRQVETHLAVVSQNQGCWFGFINRHSNRHTSEEVQGAFKVLMTHWILQFA